MFSGLNETVMLGGEHIAPCIQWNVMLVALSFPVEFTVMVTSLVVPEDIAPTYLLSSVMSMTGLDRMFTVIELLLEPDEPSKFIHSEDRLTRCVLGPVAAGMLIEVTLDSEEPLSIKI